LVCEKGNNEFLKNRNEKGFIQERIDLSLEEHIFNLEKKLMTYDDEAVNDLLAEDFLEFGSSGKSFDKKAILEAVLLGTMNKSVKFTVTDFQIKWLAPGVVLATYHTLRHNDRVHALRSSIWKLTDGKWKMVFHQGTPTV
jgi:hypothetical protein